jgi:hypothetical protein
MTIWLRQGGELKTPKPGYFHITSAALLRALALLTLDPYIDINMKIGIGIGIVIVFSSRSLASCRASLANGNTGSRYPAAASMNLASTIRDSQSSFLKLSTYTWRLP